MVKYCVANECPIDAEACAFAAENGHLEVLKYLREEVKAPWDSRTASWAAENGHLHILEYLVERKYDEYNEGACWLAAKYGHLDCLKYLHETAKAPWDYRAVRVRAREQPTRMCTIPPRQQLSITIWLAIRRRNIITTRNNRRGVQDRTREREKRKARLSEYAEQRDKYIEIWCQKQLRIEIERNTRTKSKKKTCHHADFSRYY